MLDRLTTELLADTPAVARAVPHMPSAHADRSATANVRVLGQGHTSISPAVRADSGAQLILSRARVTPPPLREDTLARDRLLDWLAEHVHRRVITVVAETGYGKTTLLADFSRRTSVRCAWLRLEPADRDWVSLVTYLVAAVRELEPSFGSTTLSLLHDLSAPPTSIQQVVDTLVAEFGVIGDRSTALILDDCHVLDDEPQARSILSRLVASVPDRVAFVLLSRRSLRLPLGRLTAQGEAVGLGKRDLRFSVDETERLFRDSYRLPLDDDVIRQIDRRTEGWAASLQMLGSSVRGRSSAEIRSFVRGLSGAEGDLYDYLVEEVMGELDPGLQRFLAHTSILDVVTPELAAAIFDASRSRGGRDGGSTPGMRTEVETWLADAQGLGLLEKHSTWSTGLRYHPLLRDLLTRHLRGYVTPGELITMHLRVAQAAEATDWLTAARHFVLAVQREEAMRVVASRASEALGTGRWAEAATVLRDIDAPATQAHFAAILARDDVYGGRPEDALNRLEAFDLATLAGSGRGLVLQARVHSLWWLGRVQELDLQAREVLEDPTVPTELKEIAQGILVVSRSTTDGDLAEAARVLEDLSVAQEARRHDFFAGISRHNLLFVRIALGEYKQAVRDGIRALELLEGTPGKTEEAHSVHLGLAKAHLELGEFALALEDLKRAAAGETAGAVEQWFESAALLAILGERTEASDLLRRGSATRTAGSPQNRVAAIMADVELALADGRWRDASEALGASCTNLPSVSTCGWLAWLWARAVVDAAGDREEEAARWIQIGVTLAARQHSALYWKRFSLLSALAHGSAREAAQAVEAASPMEILATAEVAIRNLDRLSPLPASLLRSISDWPQRWLPGLRRALSNSDHPRVRVAAQILDEYGELADVPRLRALARSRVRGLRGSAIGRALARRRSPRLYVHDLGRSSFEVGNRQVELALIRRKAASILCFLLTRNGLAATKDQVLEAIWPDLNPDAGVNSLNQTLYFLRRDIEPGFDEDISAPYVRFESDLLWLDRELVEVQSEVFYTAASRALAANATGVEVALAATTAYTGRFVPEFEYEEWASAWRELMHSQYLHLAETTGRTLIALGRLSDATELAIRVLTVDPTADQIERGLIWLYGNLGARSAAAEQYSHYAAVQRSDYGVEPSPLEEIIATPPAVEV
jgi:DNA-binding SARP family transcriptional activator/tetratricopeptide (TPR) repeat protein